MGQNETREYLGLKVDIVESSDDSQRGISGVIYNETKNTFVIKTKSGLKKIAKKGKIFMFNNEFYVNGDKINYRPEDRIKACWGI